MSEHDWASVPNVYLDVAAILGDLLDDIALRDIALTAREAMQVTFAALSFPAPGFSSATTIFVRDSLITPTDFLPCDVTATREDVFAVPKLTTDRKTDGPVKLRSYAGCAVLDRQSHCVGVFYLMDAKPHRLTTAETSRLRVYTKLVSSRIEIVRRFGGGPGPSMCEIIRRADQVAKVGQKSEAQDLIALAYASEDIAGIRERTPERSHRRPLRR